MMIRLIIRNDLYLNYCLATPAKILPFVYHLVKVPVMDLNDLLGELRSRFNVNAFTEASGKKGKG